MLTRRQLMKTTIAAAAAHALSACGLKTVAQTEKEASAEAENAASIDGQTLTVAVIDDDVEEILAEYVTPLLAADGLTLMTRHFMDDNLDNLNEQTVTGVVDASLAESKSQLNRYRAKTAADLAFKEAVFYRPYGVYSKVLDTPHLAPTASTVGVPADLVGQGHALQFLSDEGLVTLADPGALAAKVADVTENPHGFDFVVLPPTDLVDALDTLDFCVIDFENASAGGLRAKDACVIESSHSMAAQYYGYALVTPTGLTSDARILALLECLKTQGLNDWMYRRFEDDLIQLTIEEA